MGLADPTSGWEVGPSTNIESLVTPQTEVLLGLEYLNKDLPLPPALEGIFNVVVAGAEQVAYHVPPDLRRVVYRTARSVLAVPSLVELEEDATLHDSWRANLTAAYEDVRDWLWQDKDLGPIIGAVSVARRQLRKDHSDEGADAMIWPLLRELLAARRVRFAVAKAMGFKAGSSIKDYVRKADFRNAEELCRSIVNETQAIAGI